MRAHEVLAAAQLPLDRVDGHAHRFAPEHIDLSDMWSGLLPVLPRATPDDLAALCLAAHALQLQRYGNRGPHAIAVHRGRWTAVTPPGATHARAASFLAACSAALADASHVPDIAGIPLVSALEFVDADAFEPRVRAVLHASSAESAQFRLIICAAAGSARLAVVHDAPLLGRAAAERLARHWVTLVAALAGDSQQDISQLDMLPADERAFIAQSCTGARTIGLPCALQAFEAHAAAHPDDRAVAYAERTLAYGELNRRANQLARRLAAQGIGEGSRVVVALDPGLDVITCLLGLLKLNAVYVPLDPHNPPARLRILLDDVRADRVLASGAAVPILASLGTETVDVEHELVAAGTLESGNLGLPVSADHIAYIFYTSGTTGLPKGVVATRGNLSLYVNAARTRYGIRRHDVLPSLARFSFSISLFELVTPLTCGASVIMLDRDQVMDLEQLIRIIERVTVFHAGPSLLRRLVARIRQLPDMRERYASVRHASVGGDLVPPELLEDMKEVFANAEIFVIYGCTEVSVMGCTYEAPRDRALSRTLVGRPFEHVAIRVLDADGHLAPLGVTGEVHFAGEGIVTGYLNRPELVAEKFRTLDGTRFYNTGDVGRITADGMLQLLGRLDFQVQVRGMRVELGDVEYALRQAPGVRDAVVASSRSDDGDLELVAYYVRDDVAAAVPDDTFRRGVRQYLLAQLPDYMVPAVFMALPALPLNSNFKVDRKALPDPRRAPIAVPDEAFDDSTWTATERSIGGTWCEILGRSRIDLDDDFFELGGHSLTVMRSLSRLRSALARDIAPRALFDHPTIRALAAALAADGDGPAAPVTHITPIARTPLMPMSAAQERMWFWSEYAPNLALYNVPIAVRMRGTLDRVVLQQALDHLLVRHEILRSRWVVTDGTPQQRIIDDARWPLAVVQVEASGYEAAAAEEALRPFDLTRELPVRALLVEIQPQHHVLVLTLHHSVCDGWSTEILLQDLFALYRGNGTPLPALALQYLDVTAWETRWLSSGVREKELSYWRTQLRDAPAALDLPLDHTRPATQSFRGALFDALIPASDVNALRAMAQRQGITLYMALLAAWQVLLYRLSRQATIVTGSVIANRERPELDALVGYLANSVALRADFEPGMTVRDLLRTIRRTTLDALENQHVPFEEVVETLGIPRDNSRMPLIQTFFELQPPVEEYPSSPDLEVERLLVGTPVARFDLSLVLQETAGELRGSFEYDRDLFDPATIARWSGYFHRILASLCVDDTMRIDALPILGDEERHLLLHAWNGTARQYDNSVPVHRHFERQARATPGAVAVVFGAEQLTYRELDERANQVAHYLRAHGAGPDIPVGVCMERSLELVVAIVGVLKSGAAYLPLDPELPAERLQMILDDTNRPVVLTQAHLRSGECSVALDTVRCLCLDQQQEVLQGLPTGPCGAVSAPQDAAYLIYTSGSTGKPKGVEVLHSGLSNHITWMAEAMAVTADDRLLQKTTISFDSSVADFLLPLQIGARIVLAAPGGHRDLAYLTDLIRSQACTITQFVPSALKFLLEEPGLRDCNTLRYVISIGEALEWDTARRFLQALPGTTLGNFYGPTEATDHTTWFPVPPQSVGSGGVPIGTPIANVTCHVLDDLLQPVPVGTTGELFIGGAGVARGYRNLPELTAERFVASPFVAGERLYRSGDLARWRIDGILEYVGRVDHQVKIRGFRIELGDIEAAIRAVATPQHCVVVTQLTPQGEKALVAYLTGAPIGPDELRTRLAARLPAYMVPAAVVELEAMPFLTNGKIDRKSLPPAHFTALTREHVAAHSATERQVARIFCESLGLGNVGMHDNFFDLGGHSLLAGRIMARLRDVTGVNLSLRTLLEQPSVGGLAASIDAMLWSARQSSRDTSSDDVEEFLI